MAWTSAISLGATNIKTSGATLTLSIAHEVAIGDVVVVIVACDNVSTADGITSEVSSITDSLLSNTWTKAHEYCNGQGAASAGATVAIFYSKITTPLTSASETLMATFANSITAKAMTAYRFTADGTVTVQGTIQTLANDSLDPGSMELSGMASREYLFVRGIAAEGTSGMATMTQTSGFNAFSPSSTAGGGPPSNMTVLGEYKIATDIGAISDPSLNGGIPDSASIFLALQESSGNQYYKSGTVTGTIVAATGSRVKHLTNFTLYSQEPTFLIGLSEGLQVNPNDTTFLIGLSEGLQVNPNDTTFLVKEARR